MWTRYLETTEVDLSSLQKNEKLIWYLNDEEFLEYRSQELVVFLKIDLPDGSDFIPWGFFKTNTEVQTFQVSLENNV